MTKLFYDVAVAFLLNLDQGDWDNLSPKLPALLDSRVRVLVELSPNFITCGSFSGLSRGYSSVAVATWTAGKLDNLSAIGLYSGGSRRARESALIHDTT